MNDLVLEGFIKNFAEQRGLSHLPSDELFEAFVASSLLRKHHQLEASDLVDSVLVGGGGDGGIDAIVILVNGRPVRTKEDVDFFVDKLRRLEVDFVFIQVKSSPKFQTKDIGQFTFGIEQFFSAVLNSSPLIEFRSEILEFIDLTCYIYKQSIKMQSNPRCHLYYVTSGKWAGSTDLVGRLSAGRQKLEEFNIFSDIAAIPVDAESLKSIYRHLERSVVRDVEFSRTAVFPRIDGVEDAYIGLMPGDEFIKLVSTDDGELNREIFFDNVRDFQGHNPVNTDIGQTLADDQFRHSFPLLNNGITITARSISRRGDMVTIRDFQIVNGCQTTHMLFQNKSKIGANIFVPVKLVATVNSQVVTEVIKATNRQTSVLPEALESLTPFHKELEDFYNVQEGAREFSDRIYYERRSKQFAMDNIDTRNIVTLTGQIKSFIGMFLNEPHSHPRYYGELLQSYADRLFMADHRPEPYYASGVALLTIERWINATPSERALLSYKHQMLMLLRALIVGADIPRLNSNKISEYSLGIVNALRDPNRGREECTRAAELLKRCLKTFKSNNQGQQQGSRSNPPHHLRAFTELLIQSVQSADSAHASPQISQYPSVGAEEQGKILWYDDWKNFGFIERAAGDKIFVHEGEIASVPWHYRVLGTQVRYRVVESTRYPGKVMAGDVKLETGKIDPPDDPHT